MASREAPSGATPQIARGAGSRPLVARRRAGEQADDPPGAGQADVPAARLAQGLGEPRGPIADAPQQDRRAGGPKAVGGADDPVAGRQLRRRGRAPGRLDAVDGEVEAPRAAEAPEPRDLGPRGAADACSAVRAPKAAAIARRRGRRDWQARARQRQTKTKQPGQACRRPAPLACTSAKSALDAAQCALTAAFAPPASTPQSARLEHGGGAGHRHEERPAARAASRAQ